MLETGGEREQSEQQTLNEAVVRLIGDWKKKKGEDEGEEEEEREAEVRVQLPLHFHHTFRHQVFFLSTLVFISPSTQTRTQIPSPLEFFQ